MKIPALLTCLLAAVLSALPVSQARADDVSFDVFYNSLGDQGDWYNTPDYGYVWQPSIAYQNDKWRPYTDGYWAQTDDGWTWVSYENFGWATYHYGRWTNLEGTGWVWVPGYEWGPGWVSWRTSDDYVGWAPLPPKRETSGGGGGSGSVSVDYNTVEPEQGYNGSVDEQYDIGPANYNFCETRYFGAPVLREVILPPQRNIVIVENTINVTDIRYRHGGPRVVVFNGGPDFGFISGHVERPIQRLRIEQNNNFDFAHGSRDRNPNVVREGVFQVAAPSIAHRPMNFNELRPPTVRRDIRDARVEHGWNNTGGDQAAIQRVRQQFQTQARELPTRPPGGGNPAAQQANPNREPGNASGFVPPGRPPGNPAAAFTPPANDPRQRERDARTNAPTPPPANPAAVNTPPRGNSDADRRARRDAAQREKDQRDAGHSGGTPPAQAATPGERPATPPRNAPGNQPNAAAERAGRNGPAAQEATHEPSAAPTPAREASPNREGRNHNKPASTPASTPRPEAQREERQPARPAAEPSASASKNVPEETRHTPRQTERATPAASATRENAAETERHPVRTPDQARPEARESRQTPPAPPAAARPEARETRQAPAAPAKAERPEARQAPAQAVRAEPRQAPAQVERSEPRQAPAQAVRAEPRQAPAQAVRAEPRQAPAAPRQEVHENREAKAQPNAPAGDDKKKHDGQ